ncbi:hypothetical protein LCGC14_1240820 [marine sediment metagenome]|uniref:Uncharacterized protein n=1 Tax=marine sediment metagenome TaxID=412755 RepID=A0A0F9PA24_9ZZZZ|nr:MAG: hypothetical protein HeimC3_46060 [Candidatus Heimdallarchaeota archaeon LC_3]
MDGIILTQDRVDPKKTIVLILEDFTEATTAEIIDEAANISNECKDRVPRTLIALEKEGIVQKFISKERKAIVWKLHGSVAL